MITKSEKENATEVINMNPWIELFSASENGCYAELHRAQQCGQCAAIICEHNSCSYHYCSFVQLFKFFCSLFPLNANFCEVIGSGLMLFIQPIFSPIAIVPHRR